MRTQNRVPAKPSTPETEAVGPADDLEAAADGNESTTKDPSTFPKLEEGKRCYIY